MSHMKDEWDDYVQSGRDNVSDWEAFGDGLKDFQSWLNRVKGDLNIGNNKDAFEIEDDCICEACVTFTAWDDLYPDDFELDSLDVYEELWDILIKKQNDYGPNNIRNAQVDRSTGYRYGCMTRCQG